MNEWVQVYDFKEPLKLKSSSRYNERERFKEYWTRLSKAGNFRKISLLNRRQLQDVISNLKRDFSIFEEVTEFIAVQLEMSTKKGKPPRFPPLLIAGPPGIGKTHFAKALAHAVGFAYFELSYSSELKSSALLGADRGWSNSMPGIVFEAIVEPGTGSSTNPIIVLDELDKARTHDDSLYQSPYASLHSLLEPITAVSTTDISVGLTFDASHVNWIATANNINRIPPSIQSRFKIFYVDLPTSAEVALQCAHTMISAVHQASSITGFKKPGKEVARLIAHLSLREMRMALEEAFARATAAGRLELQERDFPELVPEQAGGKSGQVLH